MDPSWVRMLVLKGHKRPEGARWTGCSSLCRSADRCCFSMSRLNSFAHSIWLLNIAMENHHAIFKNGKPSISMGHLYHGKLLVITRLGGTLKTQTLSHKTLFHTDLVFPNRLFPGPIPFSPLSIVFIRSFNLSQFHVGF